MEDERFGAEGTIVPHHQVHSFVNVADDTTEVDTAYALEQYHHRPSSSPSPPPQQPLYVAEKLCSVMEGSINTNNYDIIDVSMFSSDAQKYCYYLLDAMPMPEPTWSTTATPCVLAEPTPTLPSSSSSSSTTSQIEGSLGLLELGENQSSSYSWWMGFLDGLNCNEINNVEKEAVMENNSNGISYECESSFVDAIDRSCCCCPDDWLMVPTMENDLGEIVMP